MWMSIVEDNGVALSDALVALEAHLRVFRESLQNHESGTTREFLANARKWFDGAPL